MSFKMHELNRSLNVFILTRSNLMPIE